MKKVLVIASVVLAVAAGSLAVQTVWALFTDSQSATGSVNFTSETGFTDLYICDVTGIASTSPTCPGVGDDSLADEIIFESLEDMVPGQTVQWDIRLRNIGTLAWDSLDFPSGGDLSVTEASDPYGSCDSPPAISFRVLGKAGDTVNDNHSNSVSTRWQQEGRTGDQNRVQIHIEPGDFEDVRVRANLPTSAGDTCLGNVWDISFVIDARQHP